MSEETTALVDLEQPDLFSEYLECRDEGLKWRKDPDYETWEKLTTNLIYGSRKMLWLVGDAMQYGEAHFGDKVYQVIDPTHYDVKTVKNAAWVCGVIPPSKRVNTLSFSHHETVAALLEKDREELLEQAAGEHWSVKELREKARQVKEKYPEEKKRKSKKPVKEKKLPVINATDEQSVLGAADAVLTYFKETESKENPLREWSQPRKAAWNKRFQEIRKIQRRMMGQN
jgi:hypothetical protein